MKRIICTLHHHLPLTFPIQTWGLSRAGVSTLQLPGLQQQAVCAARALEPQLLCPTALDCANVTSPAGLFSICESFLFGSPSALGGDGGLETNPYELPSPGRAGGETLRVLQAQPGDVLSCRDTVLLAPCSGCGAGGAGGQQPGVPCLGRRRGVVLDHRQHPHCMAQLIPPQTTPVPLL